MQDDLKELLTEELGEKKMKLVDQYANSKINRLVLASEIGNAYMELVDVYVDSIKASK